MSTRLDHILLSLASYYVPHLSTIEETRGVDRTHRLAAALSKAGVLVLVANTPLSRHNQLTELIRGWAGDYTALYRLLAAGLPASERHIAAAYADDELPAVVVFAGESTPVMNAIAGYVAPYISRRQTTRIASEAELRGVMGVLLDELDAAGVTMKDRREVARSGMAVLQRLIMSPVRQVTLTGFPREFIGADTCSHPFRTLPELPSARQHVLV